MRQLLCVIFFFLFVQVNSQVKKPGGVEGTIVWNLTEATSSHDARWKSNITKDTSSMFLKGNLASINSNPAVVFNTQMNSSNTSLNLGDLKTFSLFTVCQEKDSLVEQVIFSLKNDSLTNMVLTNHRMAALDVYRYFNYYSDHKLYPKIYSYTQNHTDSSGSQSNKLLFGRSPRRENLPVSVYQGIVPEVIVFNRSVSPEERRRVESYLALKYGISLKQEFPSSYLNSTGEVIWDAEINAKYNRNIAGVGKDDISGLRQQVSESSESPGILQVSARKEMKNNSFLIWGDDNGPLQFEQFSGIRKFQRSWKVSATETHDIPFDFKSNEFAFSEIAPLREEETYWLMIDYSGSGKFPFGETGYIKTQNSSLTDKSILFSPVVIDIDSSGYDVFTLLVAPSFFTRSSVLSPDCFELNSGSIQTDIVGGVGPYNMILLGLSDNNFKRTVVESNSSHVFSNISQGEYSLYITDARNNSFVEQIWVSNSHLWESSIQSEYKITDGETLILDASNGMPRGDYQYFWKTPVGSIVYSEEISISEAGKYVLSITDENNCNSLREISVMRKSNSIFRNTQLFPNPVKGWFVLRIELERKADVQVLVTDMKGTLVFREWMKNEEYYRYTNRIQDQGMYTISLICNNEIETLKLIVK